MAKRHPVTFNCPNCGAKVRSGALACLECGSDHETGWSDDTMYDGLDLPSEDDDWNAFEPEPVSPKRAIVILTAVLLLIAFLWFLTTFGGRLW
ncbi:MAG: zinc ribbon domain-containing protein [Planctomycetota bacterium]